MNGLLAAMEKSLSDACVDLSLGKVRHTTEGQCLRRSLYIANSYLLRLVQTTPIRMQPATNAVHCSKNRQFSN